VIRFETQQTIGRSADDVWAYAADILRHPEWMGVTAARMVHGTGTQVGDRAIERLKLGPRVVDAELTVSDSVPARRIAWTVGGDSPMTADVTVDLESLGANETRVVWSGTIGLKGLWRLLEPLMAGEVRDGEAAELRRFKANLETAPSTVAATP